MLNETLTFEDGMKLKENKCIKDHEDYTDEAFEKLCSEAGTCALKVVDEKELLCYQSISNSSLHCHLSPCSPCAGQRPGSAASAYSSESKLPET